MAEDFGSQQKFFMESSLATLGSSIETFGISKNSHPQTLKVFLQPYMFVYVKSLGLFCGECSEA